jgi:hypothetical protein
MSLRLNTHATTKMNIRLSQIFAATFWTATALAARTTWSKHAPSYPVNRPIEPRAFFAMIHYFLLFAAPLTAIGSLFGSMGRSFFTGCLIALVILLWRA